MARTGYKATLPPSTSSQASVAPAPPSAILACGGERFLLSFRPVSAIASNFQDLVVVKFKLITRVFFHPTRSLAHPSNAWISRWLAGGLGGKTTTTNATL
ncbi:hypothetical protein C8Q76DRAFT_804417 [Earliella scabrosa]|nr:hypothetical protein C8Q76DRAFT_804417 [Earliella scabrosa]